MSNLAWGEARFVAWVTFDILEGPLLSLHVLALHLASTFSPQKKKNLPDAFWSMARGPILVVR